MNPFKTILFLLLVSFANTLYAQNASNYAWGNVKIGGGGFVTGIITTPAEENLIFARTDVGGAYRWDEDTQGWTPLLDWTSRTQTGYQGVESLAIDPGEPNRVYMSVGTDYWNSGISAILRSDDYGETFTITNVTNQFKIHGNGMGRQNGERLAVDPNMGNVLFCGSRVHGLFKSENYGASWSKVVSFPDVPGGALWQTNGIATIVFDKESGQSGEATPRIFAGISRTGSNNLYVSNNGGETWNPVENAISTHMPQRMEIANNTLYVAYANESGPWNPSSGRLMKYKIDENEWTNISPSNNPIGGVTVDASNPDIIMASTINTWHQQYWRPGSPVWGDRIFRSTDGGNTWTDLFAERKMSLNSKDLWESTMSLHWVGDIKIDPHNPDRVFAISGNGLFMSNNITDTDDDGGIAHWNLQCHGLEETVPLGLISIPNEALISVIGDYDGFTHTNVFETPQRHSPSVGTSTGIDFAARYRKFVVRSGGDENTSAIFYSENAGSTWRAFPSKPTASSNSGHVAVSANGTKVIWNPNGASNTYFTSNKGESWSPVATINVNTPPYSDRVNSNIFYTVNGSTLRVLSFNCENQNYDINNVSIGANASSLIRPVPGIEGEVWIACHNQGLKRYKHQTGEIETIAGVRACEGVGFGKAPEGKSFPAVYIWGNIDGNEGIYRSDDEGQSWIRINDSQHQYGGLGNGGFIMGDANVFGRVYLSTVGRGIAMGYLPDEEYTEVEVNDIDPNNIEDCPENTDEEENDDNGNNGEDDHENEDDEDDGENESGDDDTSSINMKNNPLNINDKIFMDQLRLDFNQPVRYTIYTIAGVLVEQGLISRTSYVAKNIQTGIYILKISDENSTQTVRSKGH